MGGKRKWRKEMKWEERNEMRKKMKWKERKKIDWEWETGFTF